ncbi:hypothetical protein OXX80_000455 [Metschnikowia pulcherrima]
MSWRRWHSTFTRRPLTYETLRLRCKEFHSHKTHSPADIQDYILANRRLQQINENLDPRLKNESLGIDLDLALNVPSTQLEQELWSFIRKYWAESISSNAVVNTFISTAGDGDVSHQFILVKENFTHNLTIFKPHIDPVLTLIHKRLRENDFHGCFKLIDETVGSETFTRYSKRQILHEITKNAAISAGLALSGSAAASIWAVCGNFSIPMFIHEMLSLWPSVPFSVLTGLGIMFSLKWLKSANLPRVSWRPHTSLLHRVLHSEEALFVNKIVTYFEEYNEVNVKNFHISEIRHTKNASVLERNGYRLYMPEPDEASMEEEETSTDALTLYFRSELHQRRMVLNPLKEVDMFLDFWVNHGDSYEWVEPDQDPAEIAILKKPEQNIKRFSLIKR